PATPPALPPATPPAVPVPPPSPPAPPSERDWRPHAASTTTDMRAQRIGRDRTSNRHFALKARARSAKTAPHDRPPNHSRAGAEPRQGERRQGSLQLPRRDRVEARHLASVRRQG